MRHIGILLISASVAVCSCHTQSRTLKGYTATPLVSGPMELVVDSVDFRKDLTRVYGKVKGQPHTSNRVNKLTMTVGKRQFEATDVDGFDMNRWFQWEDSGVIPVEFDFPAMAQQKAFEISVDGPKGAGRWKFVNKKTVKKRKRR